MMGSQLFWPGTISGNTLLYATQGSAQVYVDVNVDIKYRCYASNGSTVPWTTAR